MKELPKSYNHLEIENKWKQRWEEAQVYRADLTVAREDQFVVDTPPPPTVSGSLHVGHCFSYTHTDLIVRFNRMRGKTIFYPMGWDDNGLPTERRVQRKFNIRCNPALPYLANWKPRENENKHPEVVSRRNFIEACAMVTKEDESAFESLWRTLGISVDWSLTYATIDDHCRRVSQLSFLDLVSKGALYNAESPTMWDVDYQTALAQADLEDRPRQSAYHYVRFGIEGGGEFSVATTRPELIASDIAICCHPEDSRYRDLIGKNAISPLFRVRLPIIGSAHADPGKGTGIMMISTFGDAADVEFWKKARVPTRIIIGRDGRILPIRFGEQPFESTDPEFANRNFSELIGLTVEKARNKLLELLAAEGSGPFAGVNGLTRPPQPSEQMVKYYEKGDRPIEFITTRQWFIRLLDIREQLLEQGKKIAWHPEYMRSRYMNWVSGLAHDWCISRQRFFGVPFPVWYPLDSSGAVQYDRAIYADAHSLPVDPLSDCPKGYKENQRDQPGGFTGDPDVMDTWATSALTPEIMSHWGVDRQRHEKLFPMDIRPQSHEIIRTWAFYTIAKAWLHERAIPWKNVIISGWILDPDRKKMSKTKGNTVTPQALLELYSADGVRYWAARARLGVDTAYDEKMFKIGQKLSNKIFNASKFVIGQIRAGSLKTGRLDLVVEPLDLAMLSYLKSTVSSVTDSLERFDYAQALQESEECFWYFCDNYLELVKGRSYDMTLGSGFRSALITLEHCMRCFLRMFAPFMPYITEEIWSWQFGDSSIHRTNWPGEAEFSDLKLSAEWSCLKIATLTLSALHAAKTAQQMSLGAPICKAVLNVPSEKFIQEVQTAASDIKRAGKLTTGELEFRIGSNPYVTAEITFAGIE